MFRQTRPTTVVSQACMFSTLAGILVANPKPCFLQGVVGFGHRSEHPVGDRAQTPTMLLEAFGQPITLIHRGNHQRLW